MLINIVYLALNDNKKQALVKNFLLHFENLS